MRSALLVVAALAVACSPAEDAWVREAAPLLLSPESELADIVAEAADRWSAASGIDIVVGTGGAPVYFDAELEACGFTGYSSVRGITGIAINTLVPGCADARHTSMHELGHALCALHGYPPSCHVSEYEGLMAKYANDIDYIDAASLETVCSAAHCASFAPER